jgi:hypothetical protein
MTEDEYQLKLGNLIANLQALEAELRVAIAQHAGTPELNFRGLRVGDRVPIDGITSWQSLGRRIDDFNGFASTADRLDRSYLEPLRDQLAHGLTIAFQPQPPMQLVKFGREKGGTVPVEEIIEMSESWFAKQREKVAASRLKVKQYIRS